MSMDATKYKPYPAYKESGVEWLGEVPGHWETKRLKYSLCLLTEKTDRRENPIALENIKSWSGDFIPTETVFEGDGVAFLPGDILFGKLRPYLAKALLTKFAGEAVGDFFVMRPSQNVQGKFILYQILNKEFISIVDGSTFGAKMPRVSWEFMSGMLLAAPPNDEQHTIAAYLDRETAKIDTLIAKQERLIELLQEKRTALISHAVTKGLNPDAPMKDSGVECLGEVPAHWGMKRLKHISPKITVGIVVEPSKYYVDDGVPALRSLNIQPSKIVLENIVYISSDANEILLKSRLSAGDLVAVRSGQPGTTAVVPDDMDGINCIDLIIIRKPVHMSEKYLCWFMNSDGAQHQFVEGSGGAIQQHFNIGMAMNLISPYPPTQEQSHIVAFLDRETAKIDTLITKARRAIDLLKERRTALISAAVTGKIDVRDAVH